MVNKILKTYQRNGAISKHLCFFLRSLIVDDLPTPAIQAPVMDAPEVSLADIKLSEPPAYTKGQSLATREAYGTALVINLALKQKAKSVLHTLLSSI